MTRAEDLRVCVEQGVGWVGFNFFPGSKRYVAAPVAASVAAAGLGDQAGRLPQLAGVFVDPDDAAIAAALAAMPALAAVQLHGRESPERVADIRRQVGPGRQVWKAVAIATEADVATAAAFAAVCDLILLDSARVAPGHAVPGGSGERFAWAWVARYSVGLPFGLAGGVTIENLGEAMAQRAGGLPACLIDIASGAESGTPGVKDATKIASLAAVLRGAEG